MKNAMKWLLLLAVCLVATGVQAQTTNASNADASVIYTSLTAPFNAALAIKIGFLAITMVIGFILMALRRR